MSLQIWLPLVKDFKNYGLNQSFVLPDSMSGVSLASNGKIGTQCFDSSGSALNKFTNGSIDFSLGDGASLAMWIYIPSTYVYNQYNYIFQLNTSDDTAYANTVLGLALQYPMTISGEENVVGLRALIGGNNAYIKNPIVSDSWNHIAFTWGNGTISLYLNGTFLSKATLSKGSAINAAALSLATNKKATNGIEAKFNDVRVYDHCLSPKEVEEIAKGLILHYQLNRIETKNYISAERDRAEKTAFNTASSTSEQSYYNIITRGYILTLPGSNIYTFSAYIYNTSDADVRISFRLYSDATALGSGWKYSNIIESGKEGLAVATLNGSKFEGVNSAICRLNCYKAGTQAGTTINFADMTQDFYYQFFKLEQSPVYTYWTPGGQEPGTTIYDCSGYANNGTFSGSLSAAAGSPRYETALQFDGTTSYIDAGQGAYVTDALSASYWAYMDDWSTIGTSRIVTCASNSGFYLDNYSGKPRSRFATTSSANYNSATASSALYNSFEAKSWHHFCQTFDGINHKLYIDGEQVASSSLAQKEPIYHNVSNTTLKIGKIASSASSNFFSGKISDVRIYATGLTAAAVKELYNTSMTVDSLGNVYARELVEL